VGVVVVTSNQDRSSSNRGNKTKINSRMFANKEEIISSNNSSRVQTSNRTRTGIIMVVEIISSSSSRET